MEPGIMMSQRHVRSVLASLSLKVHAVHVPPDIPVASLMHGAGGPHRSCGRHEVAEVRILPVEFCSPSNGVEFFSWCGP